MNMNILQKIIGLIKRRQWDQILITLQEYQPQHKPSQQQPLSSHSQHQTQQSQKTPLTSHHHLLTQLSHCHSTLLSNPCSPSTSQQLTIFQQFILKLFAKSGILLPQLNQVQDVDFVGRVLASSKNHKYLFIIWQEGGYELRERVKALREKESEGYCEGIDGQGFAEELKYMSLCCGFVPLLGNVVFKDLLEKFNDFYHFCNTILNQQQSQAYTIPLVNTQHQPQHPQPHPLKPFLTHFYTTTLTNLSATLTPKLYQTLKTKAQTLQQLFEFVTLLYHNIHHTSNQSQSSLKTKLLAIVSGVVDEMKIPYAKRYKELPEFWVISKFEQLKDYSSYEKMMEIALHVLIKHTPSKPQFAKLPSEILDMLRFVCQSFCQNNTPITSFRLNPSYSIQYTLIDIIQRLSILPGILNPQDPSQSHLISLITTFLNRKQLFSSYTLGQVLWRSIIQRHTDTNFTIYCLGQYKKSLAIPVKQFKGEALAIICNSSKFVLEQVRQLQPNHSPELIGYYLTVVIYLFALVEKVRKSYGFGQKIQTSSQIGTNNYKQESSVKNGEKLVVSYFLSRQRISILKSNFQQILFKLKQGLKDRLEVSKIKTNNNNSYQNSQSDRNLKQNNQISLCIYRIEKQINFN